MATEQVVSANYLQTLNNDIASAIILPSYQFPCPSLLCPPLMTFHSQDINEIKVAKIQGGHMPHEQPCSANDSVSDSSNIPLQGAVEVLSFIKECIFSPD